MEAEIQKATVVEIKRFFEVESMQAMRDEWAALTEEEKEFFRVEVGKIIHR